MVSFKTNKYRYLLIMHVGTVMVKILLLFLFSIWIFDSHCSRKLL